jgi:hypothetical protein
MTESWWGKTNGPALGQGDLLPNCLVPIFDDLAGPLQSGQTATQSLAMLDLIVVTQSCDLAHDKVQFVALCPIHTLSEFEQANPDFARKGRWEQVRRGREDGLHLLASPSVPTDNRSARVVDFRHIISLPVAYLTKHAERVGDRWRLQSPFLEHFSQSLARFFMRVGLPSTIAPF